MTKMMMTLKRTMTITVSSDGDKDDESLMMTVMKRTIAVTKMTMLTLMKRTKQLQSSQHMESRILKNIELVIILLVFRTDNTGRTWCYTTGWGNSGCGDLQTSKRFPSNPWSYRACGYNG